MGTVQTNARHLTSPDAVDAVDAAAYRGGRISDAAAATIASWWQSPGRIGRTLAALASGLPVEVEDLVADIDATIREADERHHLDAADRRALAALAAWATTDEEDDEE